MTPLNTIIEEEKKEFEEKKKQWIHYGGFCFQDGEYSIDHIKKYIFTTAMQRAYEAGREERDTYWKEMVGEIRREVEVMQGKYKWAEDNAEGSAQSAAYEEALDAVLSTLNK